jgi:hypothetical protein
MSEIAGVVANLKREQKLLKKRLRTIGKTRWRKIKAVKA